MNGYKKLYINLRGRKKDKFHPILKGYYEELIKSFGKNNVNFLNEGTIQMYKTQKLSLSKKLINFFKCIISFFTPVFSVIKYKGKDSLIITDNQFVFTRTDYRVYTSWVHNLVGYNAKSLYNPITKIVMRYFVSRNNLKRVVVATQTAVESIKNYLGDSFFQKHRDKFVVDYPRLCLSEDRIQEVRRKRQKNLRDETRKTYLFVGKDFVRKGGIESITTIYDGFEKGVITSQTHKFTFITDISNIPDFLNEKIEILKEKGILKLYKPKFTQEEIFDFYASHETFLLPTRGDPFGMVLLEAKAIGMHIITVDQGPVREILGEESVDYIKLKDEKYNWLNQNKIPKIGVNKLINDNYDLFFDIDFNESF